MAYKIIVAEDEPSLARVLQMLLQMQGYEVRVAENGEEAMALVAADRPDLVVCDLMMPVMDGYAVARAIKGNPALRDIPLLVLSALKKAHDAEELSRLGVEAFAAKPYEGKALVAQVKGLLGAAG
ncbi:MAG: response regulator [Candidatus Dormibacteria bacterium]